MRKPILVSMLMLTIAGTVRFMPWTARLIISRMQHRSNPRGRQTAAWYASRKFAASFNSADESSKEVSEWTPCIAQADSKRFYNVFYM
jgi:hypothetical protein